MGIRRQDLLQPGTEGPPGGCPWHSEFSLSLSLWYWCWKHVVVWLVLELERLSGVDGWMGDGRSLVRRGTLGATTASRAGEVTMSGSGDLP